jgi:hypothetical protein
MDNLELPKDLADLEQRLAARSMPEPSPELRDRIITAIRRQSVGSPPAEPAGIWTFAAAAGALLLLLLNLSMSAANCTDWEVWERPRQEDVASAARRLREVLPELSEQEARYLTRAMESGSRLVMMPDLKRRPGGLMEFTLTSSTSIRKETGNGLLPGMD